MCVTLSSKPTVDRTKPALEKQQTRKDYEKLSKELDNLTRTENRLKSQAVVSVGVCTDGSFRVEFTKISIFISAH